MSDWSESPSLPERATLVYVLRGMDVLLIEKRTGHGAGKINAPGGHIEPGETAEQCVIRELREETGLNVRNPVMRARIKFLESSVRIAMVGYVFVTDAYEGDIVDTVEARPFWCAARDIPYDRMWEDDLYWLPLVLAGRSVVANFDFRDGRLIGQKICTGRDLDVRRTSE